MYVTSKQKQDDISLRKAKPDSTYSVYNATIRIIYNACMWFSSVLFFMMIINNEKISFY